MPPRAAIYLDSNAGAPLSPRAREALLSLLSYSSAKAPSRGGPSRSFVFGSTIPNPSSAHAEGRRARQLLSEARAQVADSWGAGVMPDEVVFTSSGTEASQAAIRFVLEPALAAGERPHLVLTDGEHDASYAMAQWLESRGGTVSWLPLGRDGAPRVDALEGLLRPESRLVSSIWVNNETGVITDVPGLARLLGPRGIPLHLDGAQAWGKIDLDLARSGAALASFSGHKIGGLAGTGAMWVGPGAGRAKVGGAPLMPGKQEAGRRGGTENLLGAIALGAAASDLSPAAWAAAVTPLRDRFERELAARVAGLRVHGAGARRVGNTSSLGFEGVERDGLVMALDLAGFCVSPGSACSSGMTEPSRVLRAMGLTDAQAKAAVRVSLSTESTWDELEAMIPALGSAVERMRKTAR